MNIYGIKRTAVLLALAYSLVSPVAAQNQPNVSGRWEAGHGELLDIFINGDRLRVVRTIGNRTFDESYLLGGELSEHPMHRSDGTNTIRAFHVGHAYIVMSGPEGDFDNRWASSVTYYLSSKNKLVRDELGGFLNGADYQNGVSRTEFSRVSQ